MANIDEVASAAKNPMAALLSDGYQRLSLNQTLDFNLYVKVTLPVDGFVYWLNADIASQDVLDKFDLKRGKHFTLKCAVHNRIVKYQTAVTNFAENGLIVTTDEAVEEFNVDGDSAIYITTFEGEMFSFSKRNYLFMAAGLYHYEGLNIFPTQRTQVIDDLSQIDESQIFTNSLPIWHSFNQFGTLYPAYLIPDNMVPPYVTVDVLETSAIQGGAYIRGGTRQQLCRDKVQMTLFGFNNEEALTIVDYFIKKAMDTQIFGITNIPIITEDKQSQVEINVLAKRKSIMFDVNYYQKSVREIARKLIKEAFVTVVIEKPET